MIEVIPEDPVADAVWRWIKHYGFSGRMSLDANNTDVSTIHLCRKLADYLRVNGHIKNADEKAI